MDLSTVQVSSKDAAGVVTVGSMSLDPSRARRMAVTSRLAGTIVGTAAATVESRVDALSARRLGVAGALLILLGLLSQSVQYWVVIATAHSG
jgi:hypothetical protein